MYITQDIQHEIMKNIKKFMFGTLKSFFSLNKSNATILRAHNVKNINNAVSTQWGITQYNPINLPIRTNKNNDIYAILNTLNLFFKNISFTKFHLHLKLYH